jgi:CheY-like chemotaxis protein
LRRLGDDYNVTTANDGWEALERAKRVPFDLIITDLKMPGLNGVELTRAIRRLGSDTAMIWITAYSSDEVRREAANLSVRRCIDKPVEITRIRKIVRNVLEDGKNDPI